MQMQTKKRGSQPWWVILLLIPMLVSCVVPVAIIEVAVFLGNTLAATATGAVIEIVVDKLVKQVFQSESPGSVIPDPNDPLKGIYSTTMKFTANSSGENIIYEITKPRMVRDSESSPWHLAPDLRSLVNQKLTGGASN